MPAYTNDYHTADSLDALAQELSDMSSDLKAVASRLRQHETISRVLIQRENARSVGLANLRAFVDGSRAAVNDLVQRLRAGDDPQVIMSVMSEAYENARKERKKRDQNGPKKKGSDKEPESRKD